MILITGAQGQLGHEFQELFRARGIAFVATDREQLDITDARAISIFLENSTGLAGIINCAAYNNVDLAESEREACTRLNAQAPALLAAAARERGVPFVTYSTDFVFDGTQSTPYTEEDPPHPMSHYAQAKLEGERRVLAEYPKALVIRTSWLYGIHGMNFVKNFISLCESRTELRIVTDQVSAPTFTGDLAEATWRLLQGQQVGLFHMSNAGTVSKYDFARAIADEIGWQGTMVPISSAEFPAAAQRPAYSKLATGKLESCTVWKPPFWRERLVEVVRQVRAQRNSP